MNKKNFKNSARSSVASAFLSGKAQYDAHNEAHEEEHPPATPHLKTEEHSPADAYSLPMDEFPRRTKRTQGRKGKKKPRINMAFEPDIYDYIRIEAEREDKSMTQFVNDILYLQMMRKK